MKRLIFAVLLCALICGSQTRQKYVYFYPMTVGTVGSSCSSVGIGAEGYDTTAGTLLVCGPGALWVALTTSSFSLPLSDNLNLFDNASDNTKIGKFNLANLTTGTTRTWTWQDANITVAGIDHAQTWTASQTFGSTTYVSNVLPFSTNTYSLGSSGVVMSGVWATTAYANNLDPESGSATTIGGNLAAGTASTYTVGSASSPFGNAWFSQLHFCDTQPTPDCWSWQASPSGSGVASLISPGGTILSLAVSGNFASFLPIIPGAFSGATLGVSGTPWSDTYTTLINGATPGTVTSVAMSVPTGLTLSGSPITGSGTIVLAWSGTIPGSSIPSLSYLPLAGGTMAGNIAAGTASTYTIGSGASPFGNTWVSQFHFCDTQSTPDCWEWSASPSGSGVATLSSPGGTIAAWAVGGDFASYLPIVPGAFSGATLGVSGTAWPDTYTALINATTAPVSGFFDNTVGYKKVCIGSAVMTGSSGSVTTNAGTCTVAIANVDGAVCSMAGTNDTCIVGGVTGGNTIAFSNLVGLGGDFYYWIWGH